MMVASLSLKGLLAGFGAGDWVDLAAVALLTVCILVGASRGFSALVAGLFGLLLAVFCGFALYRPLKIFLFDRAVYFREHAWAGRVMPYLFAVFLVFVLFLLLRLVLDRFFKLIVERPADRVFGMLGGALQGVLFMIFMFALASLLPTGSRTRKVFCETSRIGRHVTPVLYTALEMDSRKPQGRSVLRVRSTGSKTRPKR